MIESCDWTHILENEGLGGAIMAVIWGLYTWLKGRKANPAKSQYEK